MREMQEVESQIEEVVFDRLHEVAYVGTPLARTILGPEENIRSISVDDIQRYVKTHYTAPRMVVAAAGAVDHGELVNAVGEHFGGVQESAPPVKGRARARSDKKLSRPLGSVRPGSPAP